MSDLEKNIKQSQPLLAGLCFLCEARLYHSCPSGQAKEVAIIGRSNAGKSSLINRIAGEKRLARVSSTPGRTQGLIFFGWPDRPQMLVDLPGYGFAKISRSVQKSWRKMIEDYLIKRPNLVALVLVMDCRRDLQEEEEMLFDLALSRSLSLCLVLNKIDKLSNNQLAQRKHKILAATDQYAKQAGAGSVHVLSCSARKGSGCNGPNGLGAWVLQQLE